jgi:hypothetical protein
MKFVGKKCFDGWSIEKERVESDSLEAAFELIFGYEPLGLGPGIAYGSFGYIGVQGAYDTAYDAVVPIGDLDE